MPLLQSIVPTTEQVVEFNSSGSFTVPAGVYTLELLGWGGGGGGASTGNGGNGGSGKIIVKYLA